MELSFPLIFRSAHLISCSVLSGMIVLNYTSGNALQAEFANIPSYKSIDNII